jgi:hypothetical protein
LRAKQRHGYDAEAAVSAGAIASTAWWTVKSLLFLVAIPFAAGSFHASEGSGGNKTAVWIILAVIIAAGIVAAMVGVSTRDPEMTRYFPGAHIRISSGSAR